MPSQVPIYNSPPPATTFNPPQQSIPPQASFYDPLSLPQSIPQTTTTTNFALPPQLSSFTLESFTRPDPIEFEVAGFQHSVYYRRVCHREVSGGGGGGGLGGLLLPLLIANSKPWGGLAPTPVERIRCYGDRKSVV